MFKSKLRSTAKHAAAPPGKADATRQHLIEAALKLFRRNGFDATTMRDVAEAAGMSLGAAYYHFRSKEDLVAAYYWTTQERHEALLQAELASVQDPTERVRLVLRTKLQVLAGDRRFLPALFRFAVEPGHPLNVFGPETKDVRTRARRLFASALPDDGLDADVRGLLADALWLAHLGLTLHALHDRSAGLQRTLALADAAAALAGKVVVMARTPFAAPIVAAVVGELDRFRRAIA